MGTERHCGLTEAAVAPLVLPEHRRTIPRRSGSSDSGVSIEEQREFGRKLRGLRDNRHGALGRACSFESNNNSNMNANNSNMNGGTAVSEGESTHHHPELRQSSSSGLDAYNDSNHSYCSAGSSSNSFGDDRRYSKKSTCSFNTQESSFSCASSAVASPTALTTIESGMVSQDVAASTEGSRQLAASSAAAVNMPQASLRGDDLINNNVTIHGGGGGVQTTRSVVPLSRQPQRGLSRRGPMGQSLASIQNTPGIGSNLRASIGSASGGISPKLRPSLTQTELGDTLDASNNSSNSVINNNSLSATSVHVLERVAQHRSVRSSTGRVRGLGKKKASAVFGGTGTSTANLSPTNAAKISVEVETNSPASGLSINNDTINSRDSTGSNTMMMDQGMESLSSLFDDPLTATEEHRQSLHNSCPAALFNSSQDSMTMSTRSLRAANNNSTMMSSRHLRPSLVNGAVVPLVDSRPGLRGRREVSQTNRSNRHHLLNGSSHHLLNGSSHHLLNGSSTGSNSRHQFTRSSNRMASVPTSLGSSPPPSSQDAAFRRRNTTEAIVPPNTRATTPPPPAQGPAALQAQLQRHALQTPPTTTAQSVQPEENQQDEQEPLYQPTQRDWAVLYNRHVEELERKDLEIAMKLSSRETTGAQAQEGQYEDDEGDAASLDGIELAMEVSRHEVSHSNMAEDDVLQMVLEMSRTEISGNPNMSNNISCSSLNASFANASFSNFHSDNDLDCNHHSAPVVIDGPPVIVEEPEAPCESVIDDGVDVDYDNDCSNENERQPDGDGSDVDHDHNDTAADDGEEDELQRALRESAAHQAALLAEQEELERVLRISERECVEAVETSDEQDEDLQRIIALSQQEATEQERERDAMEVVLRLSRQDTGDCY